MNSKRFGLTFAVSVFALASIVHAGTLTPSATPGATSYTLSDIYTRLTTNASATEANHSFAPAASPAASLYTLKQLYEAIPTIDATKVKSGTSYLGVAGSAIVALGDAVAANVLTGTTFSNATTAGVSGTMPDKEGDNASTARAAASGVNYFTAPTGFYDGDDRVSATDAQVAALDSDIAAANILSSFTIFGVAGSASSGVSLASMYNGTSGAFTGGSQANGGADDYNNGGSAASGRYAGTWTACNSGNSYCGTSDSGADAKDENSGLVWSLPCNGSGCSSFSDSSPLTYSWENSAVNNNSRTAAQLCSDHSGWSLPHQKQIIQAYIDGTYGNLEATGTFLYYWSASTVSNNTTQAWRINISGGNVLVGAKSDSNYIRCVRL